MGVDHKNGHVGLFDHGWIIKRPDFDDHGRETGGACGQVGAAIGAELAGDRVIEIRTGEIFRFALGVGKAVGGHADKDIRLAAGDVLALATMALRFHHRIALGPIVYVAAITSAC